MHSLNALGESCLRGFSTLMPSSLVAFYEIDEHLIAHDFLLAGQHANMHDDYVNHYCQYDPLQPRHCLAMGERVVRLTDACALRPELDDPRYRNFMRHHDLIDVAEMILMMGKRPCAGISLLRQSPLGGFSNAEVALLKNLHDMMQSALDLASTTEVASTPPFSRLAPYSVTRREAQIAELLRQGLTNKMMARKLNISPSTVKGYLDSLYAKVGVANRTELVARVFSSD